MVRYFRVMLSKHIVNKDNTRIAMKKSDARVVDG